MTTCYCDGPGHEYRASWCGEGRGRDGKPIDKRIAAVKAELRAARLAAEADEERVR